MHLITATAGISSLNAALLGCKEFGAARAAAIEFFCAGKNQRMMVEYQTIRQLEEDFVVKVQCQLIL